MYCVPVHGTEEVEVVVVVGCQDLCPRLDWYCRLTDVGKVVPRVQNINEKNINFLRICQLLKGI